jgi:hypothetical protein
MEDLQFSKPADLLYRTCLFIKGIEIRKCAGSSEPGAISHNKGPGDFDSIHPLFEAIWNAAGAGRVSGEARFRFKMGRTNGND